MVQLSQNIENLLPVKITPIFCQSPCTVVAARGLICRQIPAARAVNRDCERVWTAPRLFYGLWCEAIWAVQRTRIHPEEEATRGGAGAVQCTHWKWQVRAKQMNSSTFERLYTLEITSNVSMRPKNWRLVICFLDCPLSEVLQGVLASFQGVFHRCFDLGVDFTAQLSSSSVAAGDWDDCMLMFSCIQL